MVAIERATMQSVLNEMIMNSELDLIRYGIKQVPKPFDYIHIPSTIASSLIAVPKNFIHFKPYPRYYF
jgi:hypothetical protein